MRDLGDQPRDGPFDAYLERIGANVTSARLAAGLSKAALAAKCGLSADLISAVERGEIDVEAVTLARFAAATNVTAAALLAGADELLSI